jgi:hypothetical protein
VVLFVALGVSVGMGMVSGSGRGGSPPAGAVGSRPRIRALPRPILAQRRASEKSVAVGPVTYAADVAPILQRRCQSCHRPGQVAPFSLLDYDQARRWAGPIREAVESRRMPPWLADPRFGHFLNDRRLSPRERAVLLAWIDQETPLGDPSKLPPPRSFPKGWTIGTPDAVYTMKEPFTVPADGVLSYQRFRVETQFAEDRWIQAAEARPGNRAVVHHICVFLADDRPRTERTSDERRELVCYAPGDLPSVFPPGTAKELPAGASLVIEVHYTPVGRVQTDQSSVGLVFARGPVSRRAFTKGISQKEFTIPPGHANYPVASSFTFPGDARLLGLMPHMHLRGKDFLYTATFPDGRRETLLWVPAYDFGWQSVYRLAEPRFMPRGTRIDCLAHFDNSSANPANPDPSAAVTWGEQTFDEMMIGFIDYDEDVSLAPAAPHDSR